MMKSLLCRRSVRPTRQSHSYPVAAAEILEERIVLSAATGIAVDASVVSINEVTVNDIEVTSETEIAVDATVEGSILGNDFTQDVQLSLTVESSAGLEASDLEIDAMAVTNVELTEENELLVEAAVVGSVAGEDFLQAASTSIDLDEVSGGLVSIGNVSVNGIEATSDTEILVGATVEGEVLGIGFSQELQIALTVESTAGLDASDVSIENIAVVGVEVGEDQISVTALVAGSVAGNDIAQEAQLILELGDTGGLLDLLNAPLGLLDGTLGLLDDPLDLLNDPVGNLTGLLDDTLDDLPLDDILDGLEDRLDSVSDRVDSTLDDVTDRLTGVLDDVTDRLDSIAGRTDDLFGSGDLLDELLAS